MTLRTLTLVTCLGSGILASTAANAAVIWDESVNGDLSGNRLAPNAFVLSAGTSSIRATSVAGDLEYVTFKLPAGHSITAVNHTSWVSNDNIGFIAVQAGTTFTQPATGTNVGQLLGWRHFGSASLGTDILPGIGTGSGAIGFAPPLTLTDYTFWIQQTGGTATYQLDFVVVPAPSSAGALGLLTVLALRRRRAQA